jgi:uncharacterized membrane protein YkoI
MTLALAGAVVPAVTTTANADDKSEKKKQEKVVSLEKIPAPARATIVREAGGSKIVKVEEETSNGKKLYEAHVQKGDELLGIRVDSNGTLIDKHPEKKDDKK